MKKKLDYIIKIMILMLITSIGMSLLFVNKSNANVVSSSSKVELFEDDKGSLSWHEIPVKELAQYALSMWCAQHGSDVDGFMTATQVHYDAFQNSSTAKTYYNKYHPYAKYTNGSYGLIPRSPNHPTWVSFGDSVSSSSCCGAWWDPYYDDDQELIDYLRNTLPGIGTERIKSIEFNKSQTYYGTDHPGAAYALTALTIYPTPYDVPMTPDSNRYVTNNNAMTTIIKNPSDADIQNGNVTFVQGQQQFTNSEGELGYFSADEKQAALWDMRLGINIGRPNDWSDRNLGEISYQYQLFYQAIHNNPKGYESLIQAYPVDNWGNVIGYTGTDLSPINGSLNYPGSNPGNGGHVDYPFPRNSEDYIEETQTELEGQNYKTYKYKNTKIEIDPKAQSYILGPFCIDYSNNDITRDVYSSTGTNQVKFNSIEQITVYNQRKQNIEDLGGSFKIAYQYTGEITPENEGKLHRISDSQERYLLADYKEISGFTSLRPFYIVVYRGSMKPEDFTGFYAKIDFQYLKDISATMSTYTGNVIHYYYTEESGNTWNHTYNGGGYYPLPDDDDGGHNHRGFSSSTTVSSPTIEFVLHRDVSSERSQTMVAYEHNGTRTYDKYTIILTADTTVPEEIKLGLYKYCDDDEDPLYGAKFSVLIEAYGERLDGKEINKKMKFSKTTNHKGMAIVKKSELLGKGFDISDFTGELYVTFTEKRAPAGHTGEGEEFQMWLEIDNGEVVNVDGSGDIEEDDSGLIYVYASNGHGGTPAIQLAKVNPENELIEEAYFDVQVAYTDPDGARISSNGNAKYGQLIDKQYNVIKGQTKGGYLNLTVEDFENMPYGFDITEYTGKIILRITEAGLSDDGYSISSDSISVTLEYENGILTHYTENTNGEVMVHYLYDDPLQNIYKWAKGEATLYSYIESNVKAWAAREQERTGKSYDDVLAWLVKYIENGGKGNEIDMDEWKNGVYTVEEHGYRGNATVQIVVEDQPGTYNLPDITPDEVRNDLTMTIAGLVFLDQTTTKELEDESDGKVDEEVEEMLGGIEVTLYDAETKQPAKLIQEEKDGKPVIRTNPTITNDDGYYVFNGVDPMKKYYVEFTYNGLEYRATEGIGETKYGSEDWAVSSKGGEVEDNRDLYSTITPNTKVYDYYELKGIYNTIKNIRLGYIIKDNTYPDWATVESEVIGNYPEDKEIEDKLEYIKNCETKARAGYAYNRTDGTYPHESIEMNFTTTETTGVDENGNIVNVITTYFAGDTLALLNPAQQQIHLGLVERESTDLELVSGITETQVSINRYDTKYDYDPELAAGHQYIFAEDYNYATSPNNAGIAYYTEDNVHFYITYELVVTNSTVTPTELREIVEYYNSEFRWQSEYTTTKGNKIKGVQAWVNGSEISASASGSTNYGSRGDNNGSGYKTNYIHVGEGHELVDGDKLVVHVTYELVGNTQGDSANAREVLKKYLLTEEGSTYSKSWAVAHYSEINAYYTDEAYIDTDSHPGNFVIADYEKLSEEYRKAYDELYAEYSEERARAVKLALIRLTNAREDDAWKVVNTLTNNTDVRKIKGSVAEFVDDKVKSTLDLQAEYENGQRYVTYNEDYVKKNNLALEGITVELVEMLKDGDKEHGATQVVRGVTKTDANGNYTFSSFIAGDYTVRFVYGDYNNQDGTAPIQSKITQNTFEGENADYLPINGQYYQSTKANPTTNDAKYWYYSNSEYRADIKDEIKDAAVETRYSDAYDDAYTRLSQINSIVVDGANNPEVERSNSATYNYDAVIDVERTKHTDPIYAYTSRMELEIEYVRPEIIGNNGNDWYTYTINNVDFGVTPRAYNDMTVSRHVSNIKLYVEGSTLNPDDLLRIDVDFDEEGKVINIKADENGKVLDGSDIVQSLFGDDWISKDGTIKIDYEQLVQQRSHLEVTYSIKVSNDSLYDKDGVDGKPVYDTIKYVIDNDKGKLVGVVYYGENTDKLTAYETINETPTIVYHNEINDNNYLANLHTENRNQDNKVEEYSNKRLAEYSLTTAIKDGNREIVTSKVENIVDYPNEPLDFIQKNYKGEDVNLHWTSTEPKEFVSSRENYTKENDVITLSEESTVGKETGLLTQSHIVKATEDSPLLKTLKPGEETEVDKLVLQHTLSTEVADITGDSKNTDLSALDEEYSNLVEITRLHNIAGKVVDIEGYDITGDDEAETSKVRRIADYAVNTDTFDEPETDTKLLTPTISTGKSETTMITDPAGVSKNDINILPYTLIALAVLITMAGGIVLIKRYVIVK